MVGFTGFLWLGHGNKAGVGGIPLIQADAKPFKTKPENPGGLEVPFQEMQVYGALPGNADPAEIKRQDTVEKIQPPPEEPMDRPGSKNTATRIVTAENSQTIPPVAESLFDTSEADEMPPPAGKPAQVGATAADENLPGFLAESLPSSEKNDATVPDGLLPSDQVDSPRPSKPVKPDVAQNAKGAEPEKLLPPPEPVVDTKKQIGPPMSPDSQGRVIHSGTINAAIPLLPETAAVPAENKPLDLANHDRLHRDDVRKTVTPPEPTIPAATVEQNAKGGVPFEIKAKPPVIEGYAIKTTGPTAKNQKGQDVIDIRSPNREPPVEIRSTAQATNPANTLAKPAPAKTVMVVPETPKAAAKPVEKRETPKPAPPVAAPVKATPVSGGGWRVQVAAVPDQALAESEWKRYKSRHADILGKLDVKVQRVDLGAKGIFFRVQAGLLDKAGADGACATLRQRGVSCLVVRD